MPGTLPRIQGDPPTAAYGTTVVAVDTDEAGARLLDAAAAALERDPCRAALVAAVNDELARPGRYPRRLYTQDGRDRLCRGLEPVTEARGWRPVALDELREAPRGGFGEPAPPEWRPDPWGWLPERDLAQVRCEGKTHTVVRERGRISAPSHPGAAAGTRCGDILDGRRIPARFEQHRQLEAVVGFDHGHFADRGIAGLRVDDHRGLGELAWLLASPARAAMEEACSRYQERLDWWDRGRGSYRPHLGPVYIHDPTRPELTGVAVRARIPEPEFGWREIEVGFWLSAWHRLEVRGQPWEQVAGMATLDVLEWDREQRVPVRVLLLDWQDDPACPGHQIGHGRGTEIEHDFDNLWPVLVEAEVAEVRGAWSIVEQERRLAPRLDAQQESRLDPGMWWSQQRAGVLELAHGDDVRAIRGDALAPHGLTEDRRA